MQLLELRLNCFGKFHNKQITLKEGINLIYGENEAGKSTIHAFIKGMLFGIEKSRGRASKEDAYEKYKPWDNPGAYHGSMDIEVEEKKFRIIRNFDKNNKSCSIIDMETGREYSNNSDDLPALLHGLTESGFRNTISIEQLKSRTDQELASEVRNYITNLSMAKSQEVDVTKALTFLTDKKKELESERIEEKLQALSEEIKEIQNQEKVAEDLNHKLKEVEEQEKILLASLEEKVLELDNQLKVLDYFPIIKVKYHNLEDAKEQKRSIQAKQAQLKEVLFRYREGNMDLFREKLMELEQMKEEILQREEEKNQYLEDQNLIQHKWKRVQIILTLFFLSAGLILFYTFKSSPLIVLGGVSLFCGLGCYLYFLTKINKLRKLTKQEKIHKEQSINYLNKRISSILDLFQAADEKTLKAMYEEAIKQEMSLKHLKDQSIENQQQEKLLDSKIAALKEEIMDYIDQLEDYYPEESFSKVINDEWMEEIQVFVQKEKESIHGKLELLNKEPEDLKIHKEKLKWELQALEMWEDKLFEKQQRYKELSDQKRKIDLELEAIKLSIETINSLSVDIHDSFGIKLNELVSELSNELTGKKYTDIKVDEKLNMKAGYKDNYVLINRLSAGTMEQLYLALRLAVGDLVYRPHIMPILIDDGFALYDDKRATSALSYLANHRKGQVILFTCHNREKAILDSLNVDYHYINLS